MTLLAGDANLKFESENIATYEAKPMFHDPASRILVATGKLTQPSVHLLTGNGATLKNSADMCRFSFLCLVSLVAKLILCLCREMKTQDVVYQQP